MNPIAVHSDSPVLCICGLTARKFTLVGAFCCADCERVADHMGRSRAKDDAWLARQKQRARGLDAALVATRSPRRTASLEVNW